jgi:hypothetical protein
MQCIQNFLRLVLFIKLTVCQGLLLWRTLDTLLSAFSDAEWANNSMTGDPRGACHILWWKSDRLECTQASCSIKCSSTESEYKVVANIAGEIIWVQSLLKELDLPREWIPILWFENIGATYLSANPVFHARTKQIEADFHFGRKRVVQKQLQLKFISSRDQVADIFTKPLPLPAFQACRRNLSLVEPVKIERG